jgi:YD repeat-containing protein
MYIKPLEERVFRIVITTVFMLAVIVNRSSALTGGPVQPEYGAFTPSNQEGMVDLLTGDFTYSIPLMEVPGPALSYPLTLGYRAGIQLEQEATMVGLGWTLNPGAINRTLNRYPDDYYKGKSMSVMRGDKVNSDEYSAIHIEAAGFGVVVNLGERSDQGFHFSVDVKTPLFDQTVTEYNNRDGWNTPAVTPRDAFVSKMYQHASELVPQPLSSLGVGLNKGGMSFGAGGDGYGASFGFSSTSTSIGAIHSENEGTFIGVNIGGVKVGYAKGTTRTWLAKTDVDRLYGYLNSSEMPMDDENNYRTKNDKLEYQFVPELSRKDLEGIDDLINVMAHRKSYAVSTADGYSVHAEGYNNAFRPYRQDIGDYFGMDRTESGVPMWINFLDGTWFSGFIQSWIDQSRENSLNAMNHYCGLNVRKFKGSDDPAYADGGKYPNIQFRELNSPGGAFLGEHFRQERNTNVRDKNYITARNYRIQYSQIYLPRWDAATGKIVYSDYTNTNYVDDRISSGTGIYPKFQTTWDASKPYIPERALIGFTVVRDDGMIYEYMLPVFNYFTKAMARSKSIQDGRQLQYNEIDFGGINSSTVMERAYAYSWLLTGVKAPDYVDLGTAGIDDSDLGSWVKFGYNTRIPVYHFRTPYKGLTPSATGIDNVMLHETYYDSYGQASWGAKEIYYLTDVTTPSHHAKLTLSDRNDGKECTNFTSADRFPIRANGTQVILNSMIAEVGDTLVIDHHRPLGLGLYDTTRNVQCIVTANNGQSGDFQILNGSMLENTLTVSGISTTTIEGIKVTIKRNINNVKKLKKVDRIDLYARKADGTDYSEALHSVRLGYETNQAKQLCPKIPNSFDATGNAGKLTLRTVEMGAGSNFLPAYQFTYYMEGLEAPYGQHSWDRWGYFKRDGGLVNTKLKNVNITDWAALLDSIKAANSTHLAYSIIVGKLQLSAQSSVSYLTSNPSASALKDVNKMELVDAINLAINDQQLYKNNKTAIDAIYGNGGLYPNCQKWFDYVKAGSTPILQTDGAPRSSPALKDWESNAITGLNLALLSELVLVKSNRSSAITESQRIVMKYLDVNRFDHNTNTEDVKAWSLKTIKLPSGAKINIDLESDDYTYVNHVRAADPVYTEGSGKSAADIKNLGYYKRFGLEKDLITSNSMLKIRDWQSDNTEVFTQDGNKPFMDVSIRASSLFRVYRNVGTTDNPLWQENKDLAKVKAWQADGTKMGDPRYRLHLIALLDPFSFGSFVMNPLCIECTKQDGYTADNRTAYTHSLIPIDLGPILEDLKFYTITDNGRRLVNDRGETVTEDSVCQRRYVDFTLRDLTEQWQKWESKQLYSSSEHQCQITYSKRYMIYECGDPHVTVKIPSNDKKVQFMYQLAWARKVDFDDVDDFNSQIPTQLRGLDNSDYFSKPCYLNRVITSAGTKTIRDAAKDGLIDNCYWDFTTDPGRPVRRGLLSWKFFDEYGWSLTYDNPIPDGANKNDFPFESNYWDYYSVNTSVKISEPDLAAHAAGVPGGGIRVKRLMFNSGWPQRTGRLPQERITEYQYVCDAGNGKSGNYSSGATPAVPPPFNNKGDDRNDQTPQTGMVAGAPAVSYGTVHEIRPGAGKIVHNYLTCADVADFWADDSLNYYYYDAPTKRFLPVDGVYDIDPWPANDFMNPQHRWRLNKCSHFQGLPVSQNKYDQTGNLVSETKYRYQTSMSSIDLCNLNTVSMINDYGSKINGVLLANDKSSIFAGGPKHKLGYHPLSDQMGCAVERFRLKTICKDELAGDVGGDPNNFVKAGYTEIEVYEHAVHQYEVQAKALGVGTRTINSYYDFLTGKPVVMTEIEARNSSASGCVSCGQTADDAETFETTVPAKTTVNIPAYWLNNYTDTANGNVGMGPAVYSLMNINLQTGKSTADVKNLKTKNMLNQPYSSSIYSKLLPPPCMSPSCVKETDLGGKPRYQYIKDKLSNWALKLRDERPDPLKDTNSLFSRSITTWDRFELNSTNKIWRISKNLSLRAPMTSDRQIDHTVASISQIDYPWADPATLSSSLYIPNEENVTYSSSGQIVEMKDANNVFVSHFYESRLKGSFKSGTVVNARKNECALVTFDEQDALPLPTGWSTTGTLITSLFRSGERALQLASGQHVSTSLNNATQKRYVVSFWVKKGGSSKLTINNSDVTNFVPDLSGPQWQRMIKRVSVQNGITVKVEALSGTIQIDDIRVYPEDAQVITATHNFKGLTTSYAGQNDVITTYTYDTFGRLIEKKDPDGITISTQSQYEAR